MLIASGKFQGCNGYKVSGAFSFDLRDDVLWFQTTEDFFFEGAPAPGFAISNGGASPAAEAKMNDFLRLPGTSDPFRKQLEVRGVFRAPLRHTLGLKDALAVFLWCYDFPGVLGVGEIIHRRSLVA